MGCYFFVTSCLFIATCDFLLLKFWKTFFLHLKNKLLKINYIEFFLENFRKISKNFVVRIKHVIFARFFAPMTKSPN